MMIQAIHVEDEPRNIQLLKSLVETHCSGQVKLCGNAGNKTDAITLIREVNPQLIYLDIELNKGNAFDLLEELDKQKLLNFQVIFITAFNEYAVKAFRYNAVDYILKPISIDELKAATSKAISNINQAQNRENIIGVLQQIRSTLGASKIGLPVSDGVLFIHTDEIIRVEAKGSYSILYLLNGQKITSTKNLKDIELLLPEMSFPRVHHSWIINIKYLKKYFRGKNSYMEMEDGSTVHVSIRKKGRFLDQF